MELTALFSNEDDISVKLQEMATCCAVIKLNLFKGGSTSLIMVIS